MQKQRTKLNSTKERRKKRLEEKKKRLWGKNERRQETKIGRKARMDGGHSVAEVRDDTIATVPAGDADDDSFFPLL